MPLTGKPKQQQFTIQAGILTCTSSRQCGANNSHPLPKQRDFGHAVAVWQTHLCPSHMHCGLHPAMFSRNDILVLSTTRY